MKLAGLLTLAFISVLTSCSKSYNSSGVKSLAGKWKMISMFMGTGNGSEGSWQNPTEETYYEFTGNDSLVIFRSTSALRLGLTQITDSTFKVNPDPFTHHYTVSNADLIITHPCDEGCKWRFARIK